MDVQPGSKSQSANFGKYILIKTIGGGDNSKVKLGLDTSSNQHCAIRIIKHSHPNLNLSTIKQELEALSQLKHPNIVNIIEFYESIDYIKKNGKSYKAVAIIMELVSGGGLLEYASDSRRFSEEVARTYFQILIQTLESCYSQGVTHRGLKPEHLLCDANFNLKIANWGLANLFTGKDDTSQLHTILGKGVYIPPEIYLEKPCSGLAVDLFASGIILFIMVSGTPPFLDSNPKTDAWYKLIYTGKYDVFWKAHERNKPRSDNENFFREDFKNFIEAMLSPDPGSRLDLKQIKAHPWFNGPIVELGVLKTEFLERKKQADERLTLEREVKLQKNQASPQEKIIHSFDGIRPLASLENWTECNDKILEAKVNFDAKRKIEEYSPEVGFKPYTQLYSSENIDTLFKLVCQGVDSQVTEFAASEDRYKIKCKIMRDEGSCNANILITRVDNATYCVEFYKTEGNFLVFLKAIEYIKEKVQGTEDT